MQYSLSQVSRVYHRWGRHPILYKFACVITFLGRERFLRQRTVEVLNLRAGDTVLDLACGTGLNFGFIEERVGPSGKIVAFDYSMDMLAAARLRAQKRGWNNIEFIQGDAAELALPFKADGVLSTLGISAIGRHRETLRHAADALKGGGRIAVLDAQLPRGVWRIFNSLIAFIYSRFASWDYTKDIPRDLEEVIGKVDLERYNGGTIFIAHGEKKHGDG